MPDNAAPTIEDIAFEPEEPAVGDEVSVIVETSDSDGDQVQVSYVWSLDGSPLGVKTDWIALAPGSFARGSTLEVEVVASDGKTQVRETFSEDIVNAVPKLLEVEVLTEGELHSGVPIKLRPYARDADGDEIRFRYEWKVNGRPMRETGPELATQRLRRGDEVQAAVVAFDEQDESEPFETPLLTLANSPPQIVVSSPTGASNDGVFRFQVEATDADGDPILGFELEDEPEGMKIDVRSGAVAWTPTAEQLGKHTMAVIVDDLHGGSTRHPIEVSVGKLADSQPPAAVE